MTPETLSGAASEHASGNASRNPSRAGSIGGMRHTNKPRQNVKFTVGDEDDDAQEDASQFTVEAGFVQDAPADAPEGDLGSGTLTPDWTSRAHAAAEGAHSKAARLADRLSNSAPASRRNSANILGAASPNEGKQDTLSPLDLSPIPESLAQTSKRSRMPGFLHKRSSATNTKRRQRANATASGYESPPFATHQRH